MLEADLAVNIACIFVTKSSQDKFDLFITVGNAVAVNQIISRRNKPEYHYFTSCWFQSFGASGHPILLALLSSQCQVLGKSLDPSLSGVSVISELREV